MEGIISATDQSNPDQPATLAWFSLKASTITFAMAQDPREAWRRLTAAVQTAQRRGGGLGGGGPGRGAISGIAGLLLLGGGVVLVNNSLFNGMLCYQSNTSPRLTPSSRGWSSRNQVYQNRWCEERNLRRRDASAAALVRDTDHIRCSSKATKCRFSYRHERLADGQHNMPCSIPTADRGSATNLSNAWNRLRRKSFALHC